MNDGWMDGRTVNGWMGERTDEWKDQLVGGWMMDG